MKKIRLDKLLTDKGLVESRNRAQSLVMAGKVSVNGVVALKPGMPVPLSAHIELQDDLPYVSRGGLKLAAAVKSFDLEIDNTVCADVGASTGGFTDVLLQNGATRIYAIDVGYGQLAWKLRQDSRVVVMERTNARHLQALPEQVNIVTIDASFISLRLLLPAVQKWLTTAGYVIALIKPQFEAGKELVGKGGVVRDRIVHQTVLKDIITQATDKGFSFLGLIPSPITGPAGNHEFLIHLGFNRSSETPDLINTIEHCLDQLAS